MTIRIAPVAALLALLLGATPVSAQVTPAAIAEVDAAALVSFDPDGGSGPALTEELVRAYLAAPVPRPTQQEFAAAWRRIEAAETAKRVLLANEMLLTPLWDDEAFELQDGSVRPMTADEKAIFRELEAARAAERTLSARRSLANFREQERADYAEAVCRLLTAGVRITQREDGYRKVGDDWLWFDWEDGRVVASRAPDPEVEVALLRFELVTTRISSAVSIRARAMVLASSSAGRR